MFQMKVVEKFKTHILSSITPPSRPKIVPFIEIMWENIVQPDRPQMTIKYSACALHAGYLRLHTLTVCNTHCFLTATLVARTLLSGTLYVHCLSCYFQPQIKPQIRMYKVHTFSQISCYTLCKIFRSVWSVSTILNWILWQLFVKGYEWLGTEEGRL